MEFCSFESDLEGLGNKEQRIEYAQLLKDTKAFIAELEALRGTPEGAVLYGATIEAVIRRNREDADELRQALGRPIDLGRGADTSEDDVERMLAAAFA